MHCRQGLRPWKNGRKRAETGPQRKASREVVEAFVFVLSQLHAARAISRRLGWEAARRGPLIVPHACSAWLRSTPTCPPTHGANHAHTPCSTGLGYARAIRATCRRKAASGAFFLALSLQLVVLLMEIFFAKYEKKSLKHPRVAPIKITNAKFMGA